MHYTVRLGGFRNGNWLLMIVTTACALDARGANEIAPRDGVVVRLHPIAPFCFNQKPRC